MSTLSSTSITTADDSIFLMLASQIDGQRRQGGPEIVETHKPRRIVMLDLQNGDTSEAQEYTELGRCLRFLTKNAMPGSAAPGYSIHRVISFKKPLSPGNETMDEVDSLKKSQG